MRAPLYYPLALAASPLVVCQEQIYAMEWGMTSFEKTEVPRSAYLNNPATKNVVNPVDGEVVRLCVYVCEREREKRESCVYCGVVSERERRRGESSTAYY